MSYTIAVANAVFDLNDTGDVLFLILFLKLFALFDRKWAYFFTSPLHGARTNSSLTLAITMEQKAFGHCEITAVFDHLEFYYSWWTTVVIFLGCFTERPDCRSNSVTYEHQ